MTRRMIVPLIFGLLGTAVLVGLGLWQLQRLAEKERVLAAIAARIAAPAVALPARPEPEADRYLAVRAEGRLTGEGLRVLSSVKRLGAGHRLIGVLETGDGRRVLLDRGFLRQGEEEAAPPAGAVTVTGNLHWPQESDGFTPAPDPARGLWFARDVPSMAAALGTEPVLIVAREIAPAPGAPAPLPVSTEAIPNDHLEYALTWFSLAAVWLGMTALLLWRIRRRGV